ncbi:hypothetical protein M9Y10_012682, partial [Tritrichomonas musculus]
NPRNRTSYATNIMQRKASKSSRSKRNPAITIPKNGRKNESHTPRVNSSRDFLNSNDNFATQNDLKTSFTPQAHLIDDISSLIDQCSTYMDYPIIQVMSDIHPHPPNSFALKKEKVLSNIYELLTDELLLDSIPQSIYFNLFEVIKQHIFRPLPKFHDINEFSEVPQNYIVKNWDHIDIIHNIFSLLMKNIYKFGPCLNDDFTLNLVQQLSSPSYEESITIEKHLSYILQNFVGYRQNVLRHLLSRVISYLDGITYYTLSISSILRLFLDYFNSLPLPINQTNFLLFRTVFYPLFSTDLAYVFEEPLHQLSSFFQQLEPATSLWCLYYLKSHWPRASTTKQMMFIHQFSRLLPTLPATVMEKVGPLVLKILSSCICSQNYRVAIYTTSFALDDDFMDVYRPLPDTISDILLPAAKAACKHWNEEERDLAIRLSDKISNFHFQSKPQTRAITATLSSRSKRNEEKIGWNDIITLAASSDPSINADEYREKLNDFAAKCANDQLTSS